MFLEVLREVASIFSKVGIIFWYYANVFINFGRRSLAILFISVTPRWMFSLLFKFGLNIDRYFDDKENTLLHLACKIKSSRKIKYFLNKGANLHKLNKDKMTALDIVCRNRDLNSLKVILDNSGKSLLDSDVIMVLILLNRCSKKNKRKRDLKKLNAILKEMKKYPIDYNKEDIKNQKGIQRLILECILLNDIRGLTFFIKKFKIDVTEFRFFGSHNIFPAKIGLNDGLIEVALEWNRANIFSGLVDIYLENGVRFDSSDLLTRAIQNNNINMVDTISKKLPSIINLKDRKGMTPLTLASSMNNFEIFKLLIDNGADVSVKDWLGKSASLYAYLNHNEEMMEELKKCGVQSYVEENDGRTVLMDPKTSNKEMIDLLKREDVDLNEQDKEGKTALIYAKQYDENKIVPLLSKKDIDVNIKDKEGKTSLMHATSEKNNVMLELLLKRQNVDLNKQDANGMTALMHAIRNMNDDGVKLLLKRQNVDLNKQDANGMTAFMYVLKYNVNEEIIRLFLERKDLDINVKDKANNTAVKYFTRGILAQEEEFIKLFLKREDINDSDREKLMKYDRENGENDQDYVSDVQYKESIQNEDSSNLKIDTKIKTDEDTKKSDSDGKKVSFELPNDWVNELHKSKDGNQKTDLMEALEKRNYYEVKRILDISGVDLEIKDNFGDTALGYAVCSGNLEMVKLLREKGAKIDIINGTGDSLLIVLLKKMKDSKKEDFTEIAKYLIEEGVDRDAKNYFGKTALDYVKKYNNAIIESMLNMGNRENKPIPKENKEIRNDKDKNL